MSFLVRLVLIDCKKSYSHNNNICSLELHAAKIKQSPGFKNHTQALWRATMYPICSYVMILKLKYKRKQICIYLVFRLEQCNNKIKSIFCYLLQEKIFGSRPINDLFFAALIKVQMQETSYGRSNEVSWSAYSFFDLIFALCSRSRLK